MNWPTLKENIYFEDGSLRDIYIFDTTRSDWEKWTNYVNSNYKVLFQTIDLGSEESTIDFSKVSDFWNGTYNYKVLASIFINNISINSHFFIETEIENDIDPKEFKSIEDHNKLIQYMIDISGLLNKKVIMTLEESPDSILISVFDGKVSFKTSDY